MLIAILVFPRMTAMDALGPYEVLWRLPNTRVRFVSTTLHAVRANGGLQMLPSTTFDQLNAPDVFLVPGGPGVYQLLDDSDLLAQVDSIAQRSQWVSSVCSGALVLAAAGLLAGKQASTHWDAERRLREYGVAVSPARVTLDGNVMTSSGVSAGIDLGLRMAELLTDRETARAIQFAIEYRPQPPFDIGERHDMEPALATRLSELRAEWFGT